MQGLTLWVGACAVTGAAASAAAQPADSSPQPIEPWLTVSEATIAEDGSISECALTAVNGPAPAGAREVTCTDLRGEPAQFTLALRGGPGSGPRAVLVEMAMSVDGSAGSPLRYRDPGRRATMVVESRFEIGPTGEMENCRTEGRLGDQERHSDRCDMFELTFSPDAGGRRRIGFFVYAMSIAAQPE